MKKDYFQFYRELWHLFGLIGNLKKIYIIFFFFILVFSAFFEMSILGFFYILIKAFTNPDYYAGNYYFEFLTKLLQVRNNQQLILYFSFFFIVICFLSGFFRLLFLFSISKIVSFYGKNIASLCYEKIIYQQYKFYSSYNTSGILSILTKLHTINNSINSTILIMYNTIIFLFTFFILSYINFFITLYSTLFLLILYISIIFFTKKKIMRNATIVSKEQSTNLKIFRETFNGLRDIFINNYQNFYWNLFVKSFNKLVKATEKNRLIFSAPRLIIETFLLVSIGIVIVFNSSNYSSIEKLLPLIGVLAIASQRILPALNQLYSAHASNLDAIPAITYVSNFLRNQRIYRENNKIRPMLFKKSIVLKNVSFSYTPTEPLVLKDINLQIKKGSKIGIIGNSGSGKSTFTDLVLGLINPTEGEILVDKKPIINKKQSWFRNISSVPQNLFFTEQSFAENIAFGIEKNRINMRKVMLVSSQAQISNFIEEKSNGYNHLMGEKGLKISGGQRQRIAIARALYKKSSLIIFDEATSSLDSETENKILDFIFKLDKKKYTVIIISHKLKNLEKCDCVYRIKNSLLTEV
jgi:ATP-binding cassette subfamily B protein